MINSLTLIITFHILIVGPIIVVTALPYLLNVICCLSYVMTEDSKAYQRRNNFIFLDFFYA